MDAKFWRAGMPSLMSKQRLHHHICLGLSTLLLSSALVGCGSGESEAKNDLPPPVVSVPKPKNFDIKPSVEMREVIVKVYDNFDNTLVLEQKISSTTDISITLPKVLNTSHLYRVEISTTPDSLIYNFLKGQYESFSTTFHALVSVDIRNLTQSININPSSEAIYQRALIRSGQLPTDEIVTPTKITSLHLQLATNDVNSALLNAFNQVSIPSLNPSTLLNVFNPQDSISKIGFYMDTYLSFGYFQQWANTYPNNSFSELSRSLALDLRDGYLDAKLIRGDKSTLTTLVTATPDNIDPAKNTILNIAANQKNTRELYATSLKQAVLQLADNYRQQILTPESYTFLQERIYTGIVPVMDPTTPHAVRLSGAGDYRRAVGFTDTSATCNGSIYPCKQGITGINLVNFNLPSIEYLIGHYQDTSNDCKLNIRANGELELIKGAQIFRSTLDADSTDNLLQVNKTNHEYLLNSSTTESNNTSLQYAFVQIKIKANQVISASAGLDTRKAPDQLQTTQLQCSFS